MDSILGFRKFGNIVENKATDAVLVLTLTRNHFQDYFVLLWKFHLISPQFNLEKRHDRLEIDPMKI